MRDDIRSILVHVDAGRHCAHRLHLARMMAARHEARLRALFAVAPRFLPMPLEGVEPTVPVPDEIDPEHRRRARACFDLAASGGGWPMEWSETAGELPLDGFVRRALHADLLVLGQRDSSDDLAFDVPAGFVESVLAASGRPAIVVPCADDLAFDGFDKVVIAWQPTRESARALDAALPLLWHAREIDLVVWSNDDADALAQLRQEVVDHLRLHAVTGIRCHQGPTPADMGAALLAFAEGVGADLLVMGGNGPGRAREMLFGGASRTVLRDMRVPVLMGC